jgi:glycosyltransferase involved in cell wall biosynthesis
MFCSTIIPTVNRPTLTRAVHSVLKQDFQHDDFEVIVVNDSGRPMPAMDWQESPRVKVIDTNARERCVARNTGAAIARGKYLHFLDDDDWMLPQAFEHLWELTRISQATWFYGGYKLVDTAGNLLEECYPDESGNCLIRFIVGEWLPLQVSLIDSEAFFAVGGFSSLESLRGGDEDVDLSRQISLSNDIAGTPNLVAVIRFGLDTSTTNYTNLREQSRASREKALNAPGAFARLRASAASRPVDADYWHGRMVFTYLASVIWNVQRLRLFTAISRGVTGIASVCASGRYCVSADFWRGATRLHKARGWLSTGLD